MAGVRGLLQFIEANRKGSLLVSVGERLLWDIWVGTVVLSFEVSAPVAFTTACIMAVSALTEASSESIFWAFVSAVHCLFGASSVLVRSCRFSPLASLSAILAASLVWTGILLQLML